AAVVHVGGDARLAAVVRLAVAVGLPAVALPDDAGAGEAAGRGVGHHARLAAAAAVGRVDGGVGAGAAAIGLAHAARDGALPRRADAAHRAHGLAVAA